MPLLTMMVAVLVLRERFSVIAVRATATIVHQGRLVLGEPQSAAYVHRARKLLQMRQVVNPAPREAFPKLVRRLVTIVHQGRLVLGELQSAAYVHRARKLMQMQQVVNPAPREAFSPKLVRRLVSSALKELSSPPMGNLHVSLAPPGKSAFLGPRNASHAQKEHFPMKPLEVVSHVTTT